MIDVFDPVDKDNKVQIISSIVFTFDQKWQLMLNPPTCLSAQVRLTNQNSPTLQGN